MEEINIKTKDWYASQSKLVGVDNVVHDNDDNVKGSDDTRPSYHQRRVTSIRCVPTAFNVPAANMVTQPYRVA